MKQITKTIVPLLMLGLGLYGIAQLAKYSMRIIHITQAQGTEAQLISILGFSIIASGVFFLIYKLEKWDSKRKSNLAISETKKIRRLNMKNSKLLLGLAAIVSVIAIWTVEVVNFILSCATMLTGLFEIYADIGSKLFIAAPKILGISTTLIISAAFILFLAYTLTKEYLIIEKEKRLNNDPSKDLKPVFKNSLSWALNVIGEIAKFVASLSITVLFMAFMTYILYILHYFFYFFSFDSKQAQLTDYTLLSFTFLFILTAPIVAARIYKESKRIVDYVSDAIYGAGKNIIRQLTKKEG